MLAITHKNVNLQIAYGAEMLPIESSTTPQGNIVLRTLWKPSIEELRLLSEGRPVELNMIFNGSLKADHGGDLGSGIRPKELSVLEGMQIPLHLITVAPDLKTIARCSPAAPGKQ